MWSKVRPCIPRSNPQSHQDPNVTLCLYSTFLTLCRLARFCAAEREETLSPNFTFVGKAISHPEELAIHVLKGVAAAPGCSRTPVFSNGPYRVTPHLTLLSPLTPTRTPPNPSTDLNRHFPPMISPSPCLRPIQATQTPF